ncbi:MAG: zinc-ribbon domain-containing protein [Fimbriimonadales bacterium]|nr:zinc-ribbon domain-containing protein [Fimbriimonadales bacterium]
MQCPNCRQPLPENAQFCLRCGRPMTMAQMGTPPVQGASSNNKLKWLALGLGLLVLIGVAFLIGVRSGLLTQAQVKKPGGPSVLEAEAPKAEGPSVLEAEAPKPTGPSVLEAEAPKQTPPPPHIVDWLEHLRRTEEQRQRKERNIAPVLTMLVQAMVLRAQIASGMAQGDLEQAEAAYEREREKLRQSYQQRRKEWEALLQFFRSKQPPPECRVLADTYYAGLSQYITTITQIEEDLIESDLGGLTGLLGSAQPELDAQFAKADEELTKVCEQYGIRKYFSVGSSSPDLLRSLGGGLPPGL